MNCVIQRVLLVQLNNEQLYHHKILDKQGVSQIWLTIADIVSDKGEGGISQKLTNADEWGLRSG